jgi:hypothetical protein
MFNTKRILIGAMATIIGVSSSQAFAQSITFDEILANPDDTALNLRYARQEIATGRLQQAASALERILLTNPNWDSVRLLYGVVLYRLDDYASARIELRKLEGRDLTPRQEADRVRYLGLIEHQSSTFRIFGQVTLGGRYDTNPGLVSDRYADASTNFVSGSIFLEFPIDNQNDGEDHGFIGKGKIRVEADLPNAPGSLWFFEASGDITNFDDIDRADNASGTLKTGFVFQQENLKVTPYVKAQRTWIQSDSFSERWGGGVSVSYEIDPQLVLFANGEYLDEGYDSKSFASNSNLRDGRIISGYAGAVWRATESQSFSIAGFASDKDAVSDQHSYEKRGVIINSLTLFGGGVYLSLTGRYSETDYDQRSTGFTSPFQLVKREDEERFARAALGAPLGTLFGDGAFLPEFMKDVVVQVGVSWTSLESSSKLIEYDNISGDLLFTKKFSF